MDYIKDYAHFKVALAESCLASVVFKSCDIKHRIIGVNSNLSLTAVITKRDVHFFVQCFRFFVITATKVFDRLCSSDFTF